MNSSRPQHSGAGNRRSGNEPAAAAVPIAIDRLLERAEQEYRHVERVTFRLGPFAPPAFAARLALEGYDRKDAILLLLDSALRGDARPHDIRPISDEPGWRTFAELKRMDLEAYLTAGHTVDVATVTDA
jgi:hypothetical protein